MPTPQRVVAELWSNWSPQRVLLGLGFLGILVHTVDDNIALGSVDVAPTVITGLALLVVVLYPVIRPWWLLAGVAVFIGVARLIGGVDHVVSLSDGDSAPGDYTGPLEGLGGLLFLVVGLWIVKDHVGRRGRPTMSGGRRGQPA